MSPAGDEPRDAAWCEIRRLAAGDAQALLTFYNGLSEASRRTFRPLGPATTLAACEAIVRDNAPEVARKHDLVAMAGARIVGWGFLWQLDGEEPLLGLGVADDWQGRGVGTALLRAVLHVARERELARVHLTVVADNQVAWRLYRKHGFRKQGEFVDREDGLRYWRMVLENE